MSKVGKELKSERETQGKTRADVARDTGILIHHLAALEYGNLDDLPDEETVAGYVKTYAEYLGFLSAEPVAEFWAERRGEAPVSEDEPEPLVAGGTPAPPKAATTAPHRVARSPDPQPPVAKRPLWPWFVVGAVVVILLIWVATRGGPDTEPPAAKPEAPEITEVTPEITPEVTPEATREVAEPDPVAEPVAEKPPAPEPVVEDAPLVTLSVTKHGVGTGVENRALVGESDRFDRGAKVYFWTRVRGGTAGDEIRHVWVYEGRDFSSVTLRIGSSNWRTQSSKTMFDGYEGSWAVEARDADGNVLARSEFICER